MAASTHDDRHEVGLGDGLGGEGDNGLNNGGLDGGGLDGRGGLDGGGLDGARVLTRREVRWLITCPQTAQP